MRGLHKSDVGCICTCARAHLLRTMVPPRPLVHRRSRRHTGWIGVLKIGSSRMDLFFLQKFKRQSSLSEHAPRKMTFFDDPRKKVSWWHTLVQGMILVFTQYLWKDGECVLARWPCELWSVGQPFGEFVDKWPSWFRLQGWCPSFLPCPSYPTFLCVSWGS